MLLITCPSLPPRSTASTSPNKRTSVPYFNTSRTYPAIILSSFGMLLRERVLNSGVPVFISILSQDLVKGSFRATNCTAYNATYEVGVSLDEDSSTVQVWNTSMHSVLEVGGSFMSTLCAGHRKCLVGPGSRGTKWIHAQQHICNFECQYSKCHLNSKFQVQNSAFFVHNFTGKHTLE